MNFSKCVDFAKFCISYKKIIIILNQNMLTTLGCCFLYHKLQLFDMVFGSFNFIESQSENNKKNKLGHVP